MGKVLITGSRKLTDVALVFKTLREELVQGDSIIHGGATGADSIAQAYCEQNDVYSKIYRPVYASKKEYYLHRNAEMVGVAERVIAFPEEESKGTWFTINYAKKRGLPVKIVNVKQRK